MNWVQRKIYLYNVTFGLYMLDWWERYLFNTLVVVLLWFILYNGYRNISELSKRCLVYLNITLFFLPMTAPLLAIKINCGIVALEHIMLVLGIYGDFGHGVNLKDETQ